MQTGANDVEINDIHRSLNTLQSRKYAHSGSMRRLWFVEPPAVWQPARPWQIFKGPDAVSAMHLASLPSTLVSHTSHLASHHTSHIRGHPTLPYLLLSNGASST